MKNPSGSRFELRGGGSRLVRLKSSAYTLSEIIIVMLIISVIVGVTIGVTKAKLDKITNYTYTNAYLTLRDVTRNIFSDFNPQDEDYMLTNNTFNKLFPYIFPLANAATQQFPADGKVYYTCAHDIPSIVTSLDGHYAGQGWQPDLPVYESLESVNCSSIPKWYERIPYTGTNGYLRYIKCPGKLYIDDIMDRTNEYWDFGSFFYDTYNTIAADASSEAIESSINTSCKYSCRDGVNYNCGRYGQGLYPHRFTCSSMTIDGQEYSGQLVESDEETLEHWPVCKLMPVSSTPEPPVISSCELPDESEIRPQYCQGKTFNSSPAVCSWEEIVPWPPECGAGQEWNGAAIDCKCVPAARTLPRRGANLCKMFAERTNTKSGTTDCSGSSISVNTTDFQDKKADLTLRNGMLVYNLSHDPSEIAVLSNNKQGGSYAGVPNTNSYGYTVYVDINGKSGDSKLWEDVYPFYITMSGFVIPGYDKTANPAGSGGDSVDHMQVSVESEIIDYNGVRKLNWVERSVPFQLGACRAGYVGSDTPYCNGVFRAASCSASNSSCRLKYISPVKFF